MSVKFRSKSELAYLWLRQAIIEGRLDGGARLVIDDLADQVGVSQIPIREALSQLQAEGFVTFKPHVGATVTDIQPSLAFEVFGLLESVEVVCGRAACVRITESFLRDLEAKLHEIDDLVRDTERFSQENALFHQMVCRHAGMQLMENVAALAWLHWDRLRRYHQTSVFAHQTHIAQQEHWELLAALQAADADEVEEISRRHNRRALAAYRRYMESQPAPSRVDGSAAS